MILTTGGVRSLIATVMALSAGEHKKKVILLHLKDTRPNARTRSRYIERQAEHLKIQNVLEVDLPQLKIDRKDHSNDDPPSTPLLHTQIVIAGLARAVEAGADHLIWPAQANGDFAIAARITEQTVLALHLAKLEHPGVPQIETPLLELTDQQLVELGGQIGVPWELAWSCQMQGELPCRVCMGCLRRHHAFEAAGMVDPASSLVTTY